MELIRVLRNGIGIQSCDKGTAPSASNVCGSAYANFAMAPRKGLSFYDGSGARVPIDRIALGIMLAKLNGKDKDVVTWDDIESCFISLDAIQASGVDVYEDGKGETIFADVNAVHWAVEKVTVKALADIVAAAVTPLRTVKVAKYNLIAIYDHLVEKNAIEAMDFGKQALEDLIEIREHRKYKRVKLALDNAQ